MDPFHRGFQSTPTSWLCGVAGTGSTMGQRMNLLPTSSTLVGFFQQHREVTAPMEEVFSSIFWATWPRAMRGLMARKRCGHAVHRQLGLLLLRTSEPLARVSGAIFCPCHCSLHGNLPRVTAVWRCHGCTPRLLSGAPGLLRMGRPGVFCGVAKGKWDAEVGSGSTPDPGRCWGCDWAVWHGTCLAGILSSFSLPGPCGLCIRQFTLATEAGRRRAEAGGSGAEAAWAGGGAGSPCLQCV